MTFQLRNKDGRLHFSDAKRVEVSAAHARHYCEHPSDPTPAMMFGSLVDALTLDIGKREVRVFEGAKRQGAAWDKFLADVPPGAIVGRRDEFERASAIAAAIHSDPVAGPLLVGEHQRVVQWDMHGLPWGAGIEGERGGLDVLGEDWIADVKTTSNTEPGSWGRQARRMLYPEQLAAYKVAAASIGRVVRNCYLIGVEARAPYCVTVLRMTDHDLEVAARRVMLWCERIKQCEAADAWPGYVQSVVDIAPESVWDQLGELEEA